MSNFRSQRASTGCVRRAVNVLRARNKEGARDWGRPRSLESVVKAGSKAGRAVGPPRLATRAVEGRLRPTVTHQEGTMSIRHLGALAALAVSPVAARAQTT